VLNILGAINSEKIPLDSGIKNLRIKVFYTIFEVIQRYLNSAEML
jgi:hypothetical protein